MLTRHSAAFAACAIVTATNANTITDDFENAAPGQLPGGVWKDVIDRVAGANTPAPTATTIETIDAHGNQTLAVQTIPAVGTSQGIYAEINAAPKHAMTVDVRIDQFSNAPTVTRWPIAVGYTYDATNADINEDPHAVIYPYHDGRWYLFIKPTTGDGNGINLLIPTPLLELDRWYTVSLDADVSAGTFDAAILDAVTGETIGSRSTTVQNWDPAQNQYDAIAFYDGEVGATTGTPGRATIDNVNYIPSPGTAAVLVLPACSAMRRCRPRMNRPIC